MQFSKYKIIGLITAKLCTSRYFKLNETRLAYNFSGQKMNMEVTAKITNNKNLFSLKRSKIALQIIFSTN